MSEIIISGPICSFCGGEPHTLGECPACESAANAENEMKRLNTQLREARATIERAQEWRAMSESELAQAQAACAEMRALLLHLVDELARLREALKGQSKFLTCERCGGQGWYPVSVGHGAGQEQEQCEACYGTGCVEKGQSK